MCAQTEAEFALEDLNDPAGSIFSGGVKDSKDKFGWDNSIESNSAGSTLDGSTLQGTDDAVDCGTGNAGDGKCIEFFNDGIVTADDLADDVVVGAPGDATTGEESGQGATYNFYGNFKDVDMKCLM